MKLEYRLTVNDYLQHHLFVATKSEAIKSKRKSSWMWVTLAFLSLGLLFYLSDRQFMTQYGNKFLMYYFTGFGLLSLLFYPLYLRSHYKNHYQTVINNTYKNLDNEICTVIFHDNYMETIDKTCEAKFNYSAFEQVVETGDYFYLKMISGGYLIIPKLKIEDADILRTLLQKIAGKLIIPYVTDLNWKWE